MPQDYGQAALWYLKAAVQGNTTAQTALGDLYHQGQGVPQSDIHAAYWWRQAAEFHDKTALQKLMTLAQQGQCRRPE